MQYKILNAIGDRFDAKAKNELETFGTVIYRTYTQEAFEKDISDYDIVIVGIGLCIDKAVIDKAKNLKMIVSITTGMDHIDSDCAHKKGIPVISLKDEKQFLAAITSTAELAFGLILALYRNMFNAWNSVQNGQWDRDRFIGHSLSGKTLGIVGIGRLGRMMARYGRAFGMRVIAYDPHCNEPVNAQLVDWPGLLQDSDVISLHVHLNNKTHEMINKHSFSLMKPGAILVNTSRGKIVDEADLIAALRERKIAGYGADVLSDELNFVNHEANSPLIEYGKTHTNVVITPHIGGMTHESRSLTDRFIVGKMRGALSRL